MSRTLLLPVILTAAALTACSAGSSEPTTVTVTQSLQLSDAPSAAPQAPSSIAQPTADQPLPDTPPTEAPSCAPVTGEQAVAENIGTLEKYNGWEWDAEYAYTDDFDPCLALSYIVVPIVGGTSSSPYHVMLFHKGEYLGTATQEPRGFAPRITQTSDDSISVGYVYVREGDSNAAPSGLNEVQFTWDEAEQRVVMTGSPD